MLDDGTWWDLAELRVANAVCGWQKEWKCLCKQFKSRVKLEGLRKCVWKWRADADADGGGGGGGFGHR